MFVFREEKASANLAVIVTFENELGMEFKAWMLEHVVRHTQKKKKKKVKKNVCFGGISILRNTEGGGGGGRVGGLSEKYFCIT